MKRMFASLPPAALTDPLTVNPALFAPYVAHIQASPAMRWKVVQRAFWVHGVDSLAAYLAVSRDYDNREALRSIRCPEFLASQENDPAAVSAGQIYAALTGTVTLSHFLVAEGASDHCAMMARSLLHQRMFDWLDGVFSNRAQKT